MSIELQPFVWLKATRSVSSRRVVSLPRLPSRGAVVVLSPTAVGFRVGPTSQTDPYGARHAWGAVGCRSLLHTTAAHIARVPPRAHGLLDLPHSERASPTDQERDDETGLNSDCVNPGVIHPSQAPMSPSPRRRGVNAGAALAAGVAITTAALLALWLVADGVAAAPAAAGDAMTMEQEEVAARDRGRRVKECFDEFSVQVNRREPAPGSRPVCPPQPGSQLTGLRLPPIFNPGRQRQSSQGFKHASRANQGARPRHCCRCPPDFAGSDGKYRFFVAVSPQRSPPSVGWGPAWNEAMRAARHYLPLILLCPRSTPCVDYAPRKNRPMPSTSCSTTRAPTTGRHHRLRPCMSMPRRKRMPCFPAVSHACSAMAWTSRALASSAGERAILPCGRRQGGSGAASTKRRSAVPCNRTTQAAAVKLARQMTAPQGAGCSAPTRLAMRATAQVSRTASLTLQQPFRLVGRGGTIPQARAVAPGADEIARQCRRLPPTYPYLGLSCSGQNITDLSGPPCAARFHRELQR